MTARRRIFLAPQGQHPGDVPLASPLPDGPAPPPYRLAVMGVGELSSVTRLALTARVSSTCPTMQIGEALKIDD